MWRKLFVLLVVFKGIFLCTASADILVLVHGYASSATAWEQSGINSVLASHGWARRGILTNTPAGIQAIVAPDARKVLNMYSVNLPAEAPLTLQADHFRAILHSIRQYHPDEKLVLVGHSAGGVVARLVLLGGNPYQVGVLITIASPHLGTFRAGQGLQAIDSKPFFCPGPGVDLLKSIFGGSGYNYLRYSRGVLYDLLPAAPGSLLYWLNQQPHPEIAYFSIIRQNPFTLGDELVPAYSQDMNNIPALYARAKVHVSAAGHGLNFQDGILLANILAEHL
ncbi:MAG: alpha/beta hydrolase [Gammaproteobacteria bacterium]|nr:alpha/beta hydrolase [Gammaproteobacteria bacterium]